METGTPGAATAEVVDLRAIGLPRLVFALLRQRFSGLVALQQPEPEPGERTVWFQGGMPIFTDWVSPTDSLGQILVETGQITAEERDRATIALQSPAAGPEAAIPATRERLGHFLVRRRLLTTAQLRKALRIQCARKLVHCFAVRSGEAHVTGGEASGAVDEHTLGAQVNALELIFAGVSAHYDLQRVAGEMGRLFDARLRVRSSLARYRTHFHFTAADEALLAAFEPNGTISEAAARSGQTRLRAAQIAYTLWACQMLKAAEPAARDATTGNHAVTPGPAAPVRKASIGAGTSDPDRVALFAAELERLEAGVRAGAHAFELMGLPATAGRAEVRGAWHLLSRRFHPDALAHQELGHLRERSAAVFASLNEAYQILSDTRQREELSALLRAGGRPSGPNTPAPTTQAILESEMLTREGDKSLRAGHFERALERYRQAAALSPEEVELQAAMAWCEYQRSPNKAPLRGPTEVTLRGVLTRQPRCARAHYYLGLLYVHASDDQAALTSFSQALEIEPEMLDAKRQIHAIELRYSSPDRPGLFGRR
jgi:tetratricopeptide (TPR) repeat protein